MTVLEMTREQESRADALAEKYGTCRIEALGPIGVDGEADVLLVGMADDVEMEFRRVGPDGNEVPAEYARRPQKTAAPEEAPAAPAPAPAPVAAAPVAAAGYVLIVDGRTHTATLNLEDVVLGFVRAIEAGQGGKVRIRVRGDRGRGERALTAAEQRLVTDRVAERLTAAITEGAS